MLQNEVKFLKNRWGLCPQTPVFSGGSAAPQTPWLVDTSAGASRPLLLLNVVSKNSTRTMSSLKILGFYPPPPQNFPPAHVWLYQNIDFSLYNNNF